MTTDIHTEQSSKQLPQEIFAMTQSLVGAFHPERIYLFGSFARGDTTPDSDYDLMVVVPDSALPQYRRSQQAGEKALKGFLFWHDTPFRKTHDLTELLAQCVAIDITLGVLEETATFLTPHAPRHHRQPRV